MIKADELMIGNYLFRNGVVVQIDARSIFDIWEQSKEYEPIPITEEWLVKFGFEKQITDDECLYYTLRLNNRKYCDLYILSNDKNEFLEVCLFPYEKYFKYRYVHELQNLYYCLTKQKLNLK